MFLTLLSAFTTYINLDIVFTQPWENGDYVTITNNFLTSYLSIDIFYNIFYT